MSNKQARTPRRGANGFSAPYVLHENSTEAGDGDFISLENAATVVLSVSNGGVFSFEAEVSLDEVSWHHLKVAPVSGGLQQDALSTVGGYVVVVTAWLFFRLKLVTTNGTPVTAYASQSTVPTEQPAAKPVVSEATAVKYDDVGAVAYAGSAVAGAVSSQARWSIKRITSSGPDLVVEWADGNANFDNVWDNRASLSYF